MDAGCKFRGRYRVATLGDLGSVSLREGTALTQSRIYSTITCKITWPLETPVIHWNFPLQEKYRLDNTVVDPIQRESAEASGGATWRATGAL